MKERTVLIIGTGHLAYRVKKLIVNHDFNVIHISIESINAVNESGSLLEKFNETIKDIDLATIVMVYLLDDRDEYNLQLIIALISLNFDIKVTASLFNENLTPHLQAIHKNLTIINPSKIAAPVFVAAFYKTVKRHSRYIPKKIEKELAEIKGDILIHKLTTAFIALIILAVTFFHFVEQLSWVDSLYFVIVTVATVGYGDINLMNSPAHSKLFVIVLILTSMLFIWMIFSLTIDKLLRRRIQLSLGRKKYNIKNHIIVCGLGRLGYFIVEELLERKEKVIVIEKNEDSLYINYFRSLGADVYIGDAKLPKVLNDVNISQAKALFSVINNDSHNLEIGLNARSFQPNMRLILRIFDEMMAQKIREHLDIHLTLSASAIADEKFFEALSSTHKVLQ